MSLFKKVKDRLTSPKARISLQLGKNSFVLGENAGATLAVGSDEEFDVEEIRAEIECVEKARRVTYEYDSLAKRDVPREVQESRTLYFAKPAASGPLHITQGFSQVFPVSINIPAAGTPTFQTFDSRVSWFAKGVIAIDGRPDVTSLPTEIQVSQPSAQPITQEKEVIREVVVIKTPCKHCGALMPETDTFCPNCGARKNRDFVKPSVPCALSRLFYARLGLSRFRRRAQVPQSLPSRMGASRFLQSLVEGQCGTA